MMNTEQLKLIPTSAPLARRRRTVRVERSVPRRSPLALTINRFLDVSIAGLALAVLALPMLALAALVKLTSHGPAFYRQQRVGLNGRTFVIYKLRTMVVDAEAKTGPIWARHGDPRCTMLGHVLRRWCLDEIPQFLNVLRGEMSLVGPRPSVPASCRNSPIGFPPTTCGTRCGRASPAGRRSTAGVETPLSICASPTTCSTCETGPCGSICELCCSLR